MAPGDPLQAREAGLRRLLLAKRWVLAGSVTLTGLLAGVAANAFPGKTIKTGASTTAGEASSASAEPSVEGGEAEALTPPAESPESSEAQEPEEGSVPPAEEPVVSGGS